MWSAFDKETMETFFRSLCYDYITVTVSRKAQYKAVDKTQKAFGKLFKLIENMTDQNTSYWSAASSDDVCCMRGVDVKSRQTSVYLLFGNEPARMAMDQDYASIMHLARLDYGMSELIKSLNEKADDEMKRGKGHRLHA